MMFDAITYTMAKNYANKKFNAIANGINLIGAVDYYANLPLNNEKGDAYIVRYQGTSGSEPDGTEYAWGEYEGTLTWNRIGIHPSYFQKALISGENIKTINGNSLLGDGNLSVVTYQPFPSKWEAATRSTTSQFCATVNADPTAVAGMAYLGELRCSDFASSGVAIINGEAVVEIISGSGTSGKVIHIVLTSGDTRPYRWEYSYWMNGGRTSGWVAFQPKLIPGDNITINDTVISATDTTYEVRAAEAEGTQESLVTTGEKAIWNAKANLSDLENIIDATADSSLAPTADNNSNIIKYVIANESDNITEYNGYLYLLV